MGILLWYSNPVCVKRQRTGSFLWIVARGTNNHICELRTGAESVYADKLYVWSCVWKHMEAKNQLEVET